MHAAAAAAAVDQAFLRRRNPWHASQGRSLFPYCIHWHHLFRSFGQWHQEVCLR